MVNVIGLGYIGLPTALMMATHGVEVVGTDYNKELVAAEVKRRYNLPVRVNTNGQGSLICGRDIAPEFEGIVDTVSISLNTPNADEYAAIVRSRFGDKAFPGMLDFAREVRKYVPNVVMTTVETTISHEDEAACQRICDELGVRYRIRAWVNP